MKKFNKIAGINLIILILYSLVSIFGMDQGAHGEDLARLVLLVTFVGLQVIINFIISITFFIRQENDKGKAFILNCLLVLVIGFSVCYVGVGL